MATKATASTDRANVNDETEPVELVLFHVPECYVYLIPPRKSASSYRFYLRDSCKKFPETNWRLIFIFEVHFRADEWNVNKWAWEGTLKVTSKDEECIIKLEDNTTGELYAHAFLRNGEPHPLEVVVDSSRYFVLRIEENVDGRARHAFIGLGFRERTEAYDFQAALQDHMMYLEKKKTAEKMENTSSVDYSIKKGEKLVLNLKNVRTDGAVKCKFFQDMHDQPVESKNDGKEPVISIKPPPPPLSPVGSPTTSPSESKPTKQSMGRVADDDFGDFQKAL